jgi:thiol-disulfide isomerase/thioredoxin
MTRLVTWLGVFILLAVHVAFASSRLEFTATERTSGEELSLSALFDSHELVLLNFWLPGCGPSCELLPYLQAFQDAYEGDGLRCVVVYCYFDCTAETADRYLAANDFTMPILEDRSGELQEQFFVNAFPHTVILSNEGEILLNECGYRSGLEVEIQEIIHRQLLNQALAPQQLVCLGEQSE